MIEQIIFPLSSLTKPSHDKTRLIIFMIVGISIVGYLYRKKIINFIKGNQQNKPIQNPG